MRTTVDIPDGLFRKMKAKAALEGRKLREVMLEALGAGLEAGREEPKGRRATFPLLQSSKPGTLSAEDVRRAMDEMDVAEDADRGRSL